MGITASKTNSDSINWDNINTESMSSTVPTLKKISKDAEQLVSNLNVDKNLHLSETDSDNENLFTWIKNMDKEPRNDEKSENSFSDTSPFISPDMYKHLMNNSERITTSSFNQQGGAIKDDDSSTSSTSSSPRKNKRTNKKNYRNQNKFTESSTAMSGGDLSYISSSAHTESNNSDNEESSISVGNNQMLTSSIQTTDINMISSDSN